MEIDPRVIAIYGPLPDGIDLSDNDEIKNDAVVLALLFVAALFLVGRLAIRTQQGPGLSLDDYAIVVSWLFVAATAGMVVAVGRAGAGKHVWSLTIDQLVETTKLLYVYSYIFCTAVFTTKISILLFYRRVFSRGGLSFKLSFWFGTFLVGAYPVTFMFTMGFCCAPLSHYWTQMEGTEGTCIDVSQFFVILAVVNLVTNFLVLFIPVPEVLKLHMSIEKKAAVCGILALGGLVCIASAVRVYYLDVFSKATDTTWYMGPVAIWSSVEPSIGIVSACLPSFKTLLRYLRRKNGSNAGNRRTSYPMTLNGTKGSRLRFDDEIALRSHVVGGEGSVHSAQDSETGKQIYVKTNLEQTFSEAT